MTQPYIYLHLTLTTIQHRSHAFSVEMTPAMHLRYCICIMCSGQEHGGRTNAEYRAAVSSGRELMSATTPHPARPTTRRRQTSHDALRRPSTPVAVVSLRSLSAGLRAGTSTLTSPPAPPSNETTGPSQHADAITN